MSEKFESDVPPQEAAEKLFTPEQAVNLKEAKERPKIMELNRHLLYLSGLIKNLNIELSDRFLYLDNEKLSIQIEGNSLLEVNEESILLLGLKDIEKRILPSKPFLSSSIFESVNLDNFFSELGNSVTLFNHMGISYVCSDFDKEIFKLKNIISGSIFKIYEEDSGDPNQRWFFIGNKDNWQSPLFELVMTKSSKPFTNQWIPHFQIDIDTDLSIKELENLASRHLKDNFFNWKLDIPNHGVVLVMGELANINDTKIYLGLGTNLRDTHLHRTEILREI